MSRKLKRRNLLWLSQEKGTIFKRWSGRFAIALAYPNRYAVGMSNLGFQSVYAAFNAREEVVCERVFYPEAEDMSDLEQDGSTLLSVESQSPLDRFDLVAFSVSFENDIPNVLQMLRMSRIPVRNEARASHHPFVAAGGVAVFLNPEPIAPFMDFILAGEAEALLPLFWPQLPRLSHRDIPRSQVLRDLARHMPGVYVPSLYQVTYAEDGTLASMEPLPGNEVPEKVLHQRADLSQSTPSRTAITTPHAEFSGVNLLEIGRGCGRGCRFCAAGFIYRPMRCHSARSLVASVEGRMAETQRVGLVSAAVSDHPEIGPLCRTLLDLGGSLSFSSLRADSLTSEIVSVLQESGHRSVAIAPEAGSERLRRVINKNLHTDEIFRAVDLLTEKDILHLKLYFMIGLPTEAQEDLEAMVQLAKAVKHHVLQISRGKKRLGNITLSVNSFVPKPFTPFQWVSFAGVRELKEKARWIRRALQKVPNVRVHFDLPKWAYLQALLARGDRRVAPLIEKVALEGLSWTEAMKHSPVNADFWVMRERRRDELFPWEIIDHGIKRSFLWEEYQKALAGSPTAPCDLESGCRRCGACGP